jgi:predicted Rossmann fold flavoprotein
MEYGIVVVGAGAAGLMAAGRAAELGADVLLLEKTGGIGNKLRMTGKGRCNLTNNCEIREFITHFGPTGPFLRNSLARFGVTDLVRFFAAHGVPTVTERGQRVFPASNEAEDVVKALRRYCLDHGVQFRTHAPVEAIRVVSDSGRGRFGSPGALRGVRVDGGAAYDARCVVIATGGLSYPGTGSTGDGYRLARAVGHAIVEPRPGLVPLVTAEPFVERLQGLSLRNVRVTLLQGNRELAGQFGEMLFTHFGVSGPIVLTLSRIAGEALFKGPVRLSIDLKPALTADQLDARICRDIAALGAAQYPALLRRLLPRLLSGVFQERSSIARDQALSQLTAEQRGRIVTLLKAFDLTVIATRPIAEAIITVGGVSTREIDPRTMESRLVPGLYFAGEVIDVAGDTGGYNLQAAFTTGRVAGESAARQVLARRCADREEWPAPPEAFAGGPREEKGVKR